MEKYIGKPFFDLPYARGVRRMSERELDEGLDWIDDRFHLVRCACVLHAACCTGGQRAGEQAIR